MATTNATASTTWALAATAGADFILSLIDDGQIEWAVSDTAVIPTVAGHAISRIKDLGINEVVTRELTGAGYIYYRSSDVNKRVRIAITLRV